MTMTDDQAEEDEDACKCLSTQFDSKLGHTVCIDCGRVLEEHAITTEVGFSETKVSFTNVFIFERAVQ
jgi:transcription initiation factor TFIIIB Brf1 subunit/transcription initiation factor TFIIB